MKMNAKEYEAYRETICERSQAALDAGDLEAFVRMEIAHWAFVPPEDEHLIKLDTALREPFIDLNWISLMGMLVGFEYDGYEIHLSDSDAMVLATTGTVQQIVDLMEKAPIFKTSSGRKKEPFKYEPSTKWWRS